MNETEMSALVGLFVSARPNVNKQTITVVTSQEMNNAPHSRTLQRIWRIKNILFRREIFPKK